MSNGEFMLVGAAVAGAAYLLRRRGVPVERRASWDVPGVQRQIAMRLEEASALYRAGREQEGRIALRDRTVDWDLIRRAAGAQLLDPTARRIAQMIERDGSGMFLDELHRLAAADRDLALETLIRALTDYTGPIAPGGTS